MHAEASASRNLPQPSRAKTIETADNAFFPRLAPPTRPPCSVAPSGGKRFAPVSNEKPENAHPYVAEDAFQKYKKT